MVILISGATGFVGKYLIELLKKNGHETRILSRNPKPDKYTFNWNIEKQEIDLKAFDGVDAIVHLAGANIGEKKWTQNRKMVLEESRINSTKLLFSTISKLKNKPKIFISASAVGYYGAITNQHIYSENDAAANDFLGNLCKNWENEVFKFSDLGIRTIALRTGVVLGNNEAALSKIINPFQKYFSIVLGSGNQFLPWIHILDLCNAYLLALINENITGVYNVVSPEHSSYETLLSSYSIFHSQNPLKIKIPTYLLKIILGEMHQLLCFGSAVSSQKLIEEGFQFQYPSLNSVWEDFSRK